MEEAMKAYKKNTEFIYPVTTWEPWISWKNLRLNVSRIGVFLKSRASVRNWALQRPIYFINSGAVCIKGGKFYHQEDARRRKTF